LQLLHFLLKPLDPGLETKMSFCDKNTEKSAGKTKKGEQEAFVAFEKRVTLVQDCVQLPPTDDKHLSNFCQNPCSRSLVPPPSPP